MGSVALEGFGSGGAALNFKVVPGLTQPGTASENTIWVKTEKINYWYFSATQPEGLQEWDVWFQTGTESDCAFNALRKNGLKVYPLSAKQMISGALVDVEAMIYQNGEWVEWITILYHPDGYKGNWIPGAYWYIADASNNKAPTIAFTDDIMQISLSGPNLRGVAINDTLVNFSGKKKITLTTSFTGASGSRVGVYVIDKIGNNFTRLQYALDDPYSGDKTIELNVSGLGDINAYVAIAIYVATSSSVAAIARVKELIVS